MNYKFKIAAIVSFCLISLLPANIYSQTIKRYTDQIQGVGLKPDLRNHISFARQMMADKNFEGAAAFLEIQFEKYPNHVQLKNLLMQCYDKSRQYSKTENIFRKDLSNNPTNINLNVKLAEVLVKQNRTDEALTYYDKASAQVENFNAPNLDYIINSMLFSSLENEVEQLIIKWRRQSKNPNLLAVSMGTLWERQKKYSQAAFEYYKLLPDTTRQGERAEQKFNLLLNFIDSAEETEKFLLSRDDLYQIERAVNILSMYYLRIKKYDQALAMTITKDSLTGYAANTMISFMNNCSHRKLYELTVKAGEYLFENSPQGKPPSQARFLYAEALAEIGRFDESRAVYDNIFAEAKYSRDKTAALYNLGRIYTDHIKDYQTALIYFDSLVKYHPGGINLIYTKKKIPTCYLGLGMFEEMRSSLKDLLSIRLKVDDKEQAEFNLALIYFFEKKHDSTKTALNKLMIDYPKGFYVNDALKLLMVIGEAQTNQAVLDNYADAYMYSLRDMYDSQAIALEFVADNEDSLLADLALYELAQLYFKQNDTALVLSQYQKIIDDFGESYYRPFALKGKADLIVADPEKKEEAVEIYRMLLMEHPNYPFTDEIRNRIKEFGLSDDSA